jgi:hypothetical protein
VIGLTLIILNFEFLVFNFFFRHGPTQTYTDRNHGIPGDLEVMRHASLQAGRPGSSPSNTGNWELEKVRFVQKEVEKMGRCVNAIVSASPAPNSLFKMRSIAES